MITAAFIGSAALGAAFGEVFAVLYETVTDVTNKTGAFKSILERLKSTLDVLDPLVKDIQRSNRELGRPEEETKDLIEQMKKGEKLVRKYSKLPWWKYGMRSHYANKLCNLDEALLRFFQVNIPARAMRNGMEILKRVNDLCAQMNTVGMNGGLSCAVPEPPDFTVGLDVSLKEFKMQLLREEVSMLVLTAPGGCGKTTLVTMLCQDEEIKGSSAICKSRLATHPNKVDVTGTYKDNIFFVPVTKTPNVKVIVCKIFHHKGYPVREFQSDEDAINQLKQLLNPNKQTNPILLILDDVWSGSESLIEIFKFDMPNYKILVTSRTAFPRFSFKYYLEPLNPEDAKTLFLHSSTLQDGSSYIPDEDTIKKIVKFCGRFPLALQVIGRSLCGESVATWRKRVKDWSSGDSILDSDGDLLERLKSSLEFSDKKVNPKYAVIMKECFMDLGLFPEDQRIPVAALIDMWAELYELDEDGSIANLLEVSARNLASLVVTRKDASEVGSYYSEDFVLQHDILRELAIHQSSQEPVEQRTKLIMNISGNNLPKWWLEQKQQPISAHLLSISTDQKFSSSWCNMQPPEVEVLVLNFQTKNYTIPEFVEKMYKLKVLIVTNYGFLPAELGNFQLLAAVPCLKRIRLEKVSIPFLCKTPVQLWNLEKISLFMCNIGQAFRNCTIQISDLLPNLMELNIDYCNDLVELPDGLCDIVSLKKLSITNCHKLFALPREIGKLRNLEVLRLRSCTDLLELPESIRSLYNLSILDISDCLSIRKLPKHIGELCHLKELHMKGCLRLRNQLPPSTMHLEQLKLVICDEEIRTKFWEPIQEFLPSLDIKVAEKDINLNWLPNRF